MDLSGSMQGAGGVGGLLMVTEHSAQSTAHFYPTYDGNGNVSEYLDSTGASVAHYEYDAFGNEIVAATSSSLAQNFSHRFSTKYYDEESGLYYYGYRDYDPTVGRWLHRDRLGGRGGLNIYGMVGNNTVNDSDYLGLLSEAEKSCICDLIDSMGDQEQFESKIRDSINFSGEGNTAAGQQRVIDALSKMGKSKGKNGGASVGFSLLAKFICEDKSDRDVVLENGADASIVGDIYKGFEMHLDPEGWEQRLSLIHI